MFDRRASLSLLVSLLVAFAAPGCDDLCGQLEMESTGCQESVDPPEVSVTHLSLVDAPDPQGLAANFCADHFGVLGMAACEAALGSPPPPSDLGFTFGLGLTMSNPEDVPVPATDVLVELTLFDDDAAALGSVCVSLCGADDPDCDGSPKPGACDREGAIDTLDEAAEVVPALISGIATGETLDELKKSSVPAGGDVTLELAFDLGIDEALDVIGAASDRFMDDAISGSDLSIAIPVT
ncbi:MAG: hypothetical protein QF464_03860, partial [Myxococcota bacterium]|nr:hypothetical protein [Myxococcota bacterium]